MFFSKFLCLCYLMGLVNTYTISKTRNEKIYNNIIDNINEADNPQESIIHSKDRNCRREVKGPDLTLVTTTKYHSSKLHKTFKPRRGFWRKFKNKQKTTIRINDYDSINLDYNNIPDQNESFDYNNLRKKRSENVKEMANETVVPISKRAGNKTEANLKPYQKYINDVVKNITEVKTNKLYNNDLGRFIINTTRVTDINLFQKNKDESTPKGIEVQSIETTKLANAEESEMATAQIEALLNEIKGRALKMVSEINPSISDLITNTVTETTFEADPLLKKIALTTPGFAFSTFVAVTNSLDKRNINETDTNTLSPHKIDSRSLKEDGMTIAQTLEDYLQKELKNWYKKVKDTVHKDFQKEVKHAKSTIKKESSNVTKKITSGPNTKAISNASKSTKKKPIVRPNRGDATKSKKVTSTSTIDDYILLTLYEQILAKTHEDNVMKMVTMPALSLMNKGNERMIYKRNSKNLEDVKLKEDMQKIYDDVVVPDAYDLSSDINVDMNSPSNDYPEEGNNQGTTEKLVTDTSYEGLTKKIAYNDYVNGYKYYLNYQKDEANTNFSNLIKYQAHRHHNVDDIGKYILNKLPQITTVKREKRAKNKINDDNYFDDQEVSTKTDDSWFKKHFYMFVDKGPPKKYHTSQTVAFKPPTGEVGTRNLPSTNKEIDERDVDESNKNEEDKTGGAPEISLDDLSKDLEGRLSSMGKVDEQDTSISKTDSIPNSKDAENSFQSLPMIKELQLNIGKIFGKGRRTPSSTKINEKLKNNDNNEGIDYSEDENLEGFNMAFINNLEDNSEHDFNFGRVKRYPMKHNKLHNKVLDSSKSTGAKILSSNNTAKDKKYGYVNIDLVPTQIVTLRDKKDSKLKKLLNVFHRNKNKVHKRDNIRMQRFNPLKKIKDMFISKGDEKLNNKAVSGLDYELLTTRLTGFKPYKFDRVQTLEDISKQIPNITDDLREKAKINEIVNDYDIKKDVPDVTEVTKDNFMVYTGYNLKDNLLDTVESQLEVNMQSTVDNSVSDFTIPTSTSSSTTFTYPTFTTKPKLTPFPIINYKFKDSTYNDNLLAVNILENLAKSETNTIYNLQLTEDVNKVIENLRAKVTSSNNYYDRSNIQKLSIPKYTTVDAKETAKIDKTTENQGIIIGKKETRIATFHYKPKPEIDTIDIVHVLEAPHLYEGMYETHIPVGSDNDRNSLNTDKLYLNNMKTSKLDKKGLESFITILPTNVTNALGLEDGKTLKPYPDYFNDLIMWNNDILNYDRLPQWHNLINSDLATEYSTPDVQDIRRELNDLEEVLDSYHTSENGERNDVTKFFEVSGKHNLIPQVTKGDLIRRVAVQDDAIGSSNEILIKGEAKYFRYDKQPVGLAEEFIRRIDVVNRVHNFKDTPKKIPSQGIKFMDSKRSNSLPVDSTLFSYDDDVDFVTASLTQKKLSKNSLKVQGKRNHTTIKPLTKTNASPKQHFATPLPMKKQNFENFLKDNNLDVASVTSPVMELPSVTNNEIITEKHGTKDYFHKDTKVLDKDKKLFDANKKLFKEKYRKIDSNKPKTARNKLEADLEDLNRLHRELFANSDNLKVKRDTIKQNACDPETFDGLILFDEGKIDEQRDG